MKTRSVVFAFGMMSMLCCGGTSIAGVTVTFQQVGSDVVATASGSISSWAGLSGPIFSGAGDNSSLYSGYAYMGMANQSTNWNYQGYSATSGSGAWLSSPANFGTTTQDGYAATTAIGSPRFFVAANGFFVDTAYTLGSSFTNVSTWANSTISSLGLAAGTYTYSWAGDSFGVAVVPEPVSTSMAAAAGLAIACVARRRHRAAGSHRRSKA